METDLGRSRSTGRGRHGKKPHAVDGHLVHEHHDDRDICSSWNNDPSST